MKPMTVPRIAGVLLTALLAACTSSASPSALPLASGGVPAQASPSLLASPAGSSPPSSAGKVGGGPLLVWQLDGLSGTDAKTESVFTVDVGTGEQRKLGSLPVNEDTCCPEDISWSSDHRTAYLFTYRFRGIVDLQAGEVRQPTGTTIGQGLTISHHGDRLATVDMVTGTSETIVITDLAGHRLARLQLPPKAWQTQVWWSPDDSILLASTMLPLTTGGIVLAHAFLCCSIDHGPVATHLLVVPVDGGPVRDLVDNAAEIQADQASPSPTPPPGTKVSSFSPQERVIEPIAWSPDGRDIAYVDRVCPPFWDYHHRQPCPGTLVLVDVASGKRSALTDGAMQIDYVSWAPDAQRLAFIASRPNESTALFVIGRDGGAQKRVTDADEWAAWSPDGSWLVFRRVTAEPVDGDRANIWVIPADGGNAQHIADHAAAGW